MLGVSGLTDKLSRFQTPTGEPYVAYGDPAYGLAGNIIRSFRGAHIADDEQAFNREMSKVRTCVEWGFGKICLNFAYLDFRAMCCVWGPCLWFGRQHHWIISRSPYC